MQSRDDEQDWTVDVLPCLAPTSIFTAFLRSVCMALFTCLLAWLVDLFVGWLVVFWFLHKFNQLTTMFSFWTF